MLGALLVGAKLLECPVPAGLVQNPGWFFEHIRVFSKSWLGSQEELQEGGLLLSYCSFLVDLC